jgi:hypothetical protein
VRLTAADVKDGVEDEILLAIHDSFLGAHHRLHALRHEALCLALLCLADGSGPLALGIHAGIFHGDRNRIWDSCDKKTER